MGVNVSKRLKQIMKASGVEQKMIAAAIKMNPATLSLRLKKDPEWLEMLDGICDYLGIKKYMLFVEDEELADISGVSPEWAEVWIKIQGMTPDKRSDFIRKVRKLAESETE